MTFSVNDSPLAGREGGKVTSRMIAERLFREAEGNVAIQRQRERGEGCGRGRRARRIAARRADRDDAARGLRTVDLAPARAVQDRSQTGQRLEPIEEVVVDVDEEFAGIVVDKMSRRKAEMQDMRPSGGGKLRLTFLAPTRGLIGYHGEFLTDTRGTRRDEPAVPRLRAVQGADRGAAQRRLISTADGAAVAYALWNLEERGPMFIAPGVPVYEGMIIGAHSRGNDLDVNPLKGKQLTNIRTTSKDEAVRLTPPILMSLEQAIAYIDDDELVEVTPKSIRLRKRLLDPNDAQARRRAPPRRSSGRRQTSDFAP